MNENRQRRSTERALSIAFGGLVFSGTRSPGNRSSYRSGSGEIETRLNFITGFDIADSDANEMRRGRVLTGDPHVTREGQHPRDNRCQCIWKTELTPNASLLAERGEHARATNDANAVAREEAVGQIHHYNIACVFAVSSAAAENNGKLAAADRTRLKAQYADRALEFLRQAIAEGYQDISLLKDDPDLASLHSCEDFQKLVREVERKSRK